MRDPSIYNRQLVETITAQMLKWNQRNQTQFRQSFNHFKWFPFINLLIADLESSWWNANRFLRTNSPPNCLSSARPCWFCRLVQIHRTQLVELLLNVMIKVLELGFINEQVTANKVITPLTCSNSKRSRWCFHEREKQIPVAFSKMKFSGIIYHWTYKRGR